MSILSPLTTFLIGFIYHLKELINKKKLKKISKIKSVFIMSDPTTEIKKGSLEIPDRSTKKMVLFQLNIIIGGILYTMWNRIQFFAVSLLLIPQITIVFIYLVYSIVDGINDPIIGYLIDRSKRFTKRYGKRFPWIMIGTIAAPIFLILCFIPIVVVQVDSKGNVTDSNAVLIAALWLILLMCVYESFRTLAEVNLNALIPDMYRGEEQRRNLGFIGQIIGIISSLLGAILIPLLLVVYGGVTSINAYIFTVISIVIISFVLMIPFSFGAREPEDMKVFRADLDEAGKGTSPVKEVVTRVLKDRNWMAFTFAVFFWAIAGMCLVAGLDFFIVHYLGLSYSAIIFPSLAAIGGGVLSIPIFMKIIKKLGAKKAYLTSIIMFAVFYFAFFFVEDIIELTIAFIFVGIASGGQGITYIIVSSEAIDNSVLLSGKREEGTYNGILRIFTGFSYVFQALIFATVSSYTGYIPAKGKNQTELARFGLKLQMSLIPMVIILIGIIIFIYFYNITKEDALANKKKLLEMRL